MGRRDRRHGSGARSGAGPRSSLVLVLLGRRRCGVPVRPRRPLVRRPTSPTPPPSRPRSRRRPGSTLPAAGRARRRSPSRGDGTRPAAGRRCAGRWRRCCTTRTSGRRVFAVVADVDGGRAGLHRRAPVRRSPPRRSSCSPRSRRSRSLGPDHAFETTRRARRAAAGSSWSAAATRCSPDRRRRRRLARTAPTSSTLARQTARRAARASGRQRVRAVLRRLPVHRPGGQPALAADYVPDGVVSPITASGSTRAAPRSGFGRVADPAATAAAGSPSRSRRRGIAGHRSRPARRTPPPAPTSWPRSPARRCRRSSSGCSTSATTRRAEVLAHHVGLAVVREGASRPASRACSRTLRGLGVAARTAPSSTTAAGCPATTGSTRDTLLDVLRVAAAPDHPELARRSPGCRSPGSPARSPYRFVDVAPRGPRAGARQDRHPHRGQLAGRHGHRPGRHHRWCSR